MSEPLKETGTYDVLERIEKTINKIRPYIQQDGGDVELVDFQDGVVTVKMLGACAGCMAIDATLTDGIQAILLDEVPEVKEVKLDTSYSGFDGFGVGNGSGYSWY
ncbi:MAG: NifU family protein [Solobacterium sp.]|nr:NifU family protein [Solobacterium sp.]